MQKYQGQNFSIELESTPGGAMLIQQVLHPIMHTGELPGTYEFLAKNVASIFENQCFNNQQLKFEEEVRATEIGHLFEHLVLEFLKIEAEKVTDEVSFRGETIWDWSKNGYGKFLINISLKRAEWKFLDHAIEQAVRVLDELYLLHNKTLRAEFLNPALVDA